MGGGASRAKGKRKAFKQAAKFTGKLKVLGRTEPEKNRIHDLDTKSDLHSNSENKVGDTVVDVAVDTKNTSASKEEQVDHVKQNTRPVAVNSIDVLDKPSIDNSSPPKEQCQCLQDLKHVAEFEAGEQVQVKVENTLDQRRRRQQKQKEAKFLQDVQQVESLSSNFAPNVSKVKRRHPMEVDELGPHPALGMGRKPRASSPPDAIAQPVDSLARPMTSLVMSAPVTGSYFWSNCVILRVDLDPKHKCKHPDTWAIYRVKFNDEEHPHLIGTEASKIKPERMRRFQQATTNKPLSKQELKEKNDRMYEQFLLEKERREKMEADVELRQSLRSAHADKNQVNFLSGIKKMIDQDRSTNIFNSSHELFYETAEKLEGIEKEQRELARTKYREEEAKSRDSRMATASKDDITAAWVRFFNTSGNKKISGTSQNHDSVFYWYNSITGESVFTRPEGFSTPRSTMPGGDSAKKIQRAARGWKGRRRARMVKATHNLEVEVGRAKERRDSMALMAAIHVALEQGMDDDCDIYYEAGILLEELENGGSIDETDETPTTEDNYDEAEINEFLFGKPDHDIDDLYNFDDL